MDEINTIKSSKHICGDYQTLKMLGYCDSQLDLGELLITEKRYNDNDSIICKTNEELLQANNICIEAEIANKNDEQNLLNNFKIGKVIVALYKHNNEPCGTACVNFIHDKMIIGGVATSLKYRGKGYGKLALEKVLHTVNSNCYLFVSTPLH